MRPKWKKRLPFLLLVIPALYVGTFKVLMPRVLPTVRPMVEETAAQYINGKLHIDRIEVSPDLTFRIKDSAVYDRAGILVAKIPEVAVRVNPLNLLLGHGISRMVSLVAINNLDVHRSRIDIEIEVAKLISIKGRTRKLLRPSGIVTAIVHKIVVVSHIVIIRQMAR